MREAGGVTAAPASAWLVAALALGALAGAAQLAGLPTAYPALVLAAALAALAQQTLP